MHEVLHHPGIQLVKGRVWNMSTFYILLTLSLWLLLYTGNVFKTSYCLQLSAFPFIVEWLTSWTRGSCSCSKGKAKRYKVFVAKNRVFLIPVLSKDCGNWRKNLLPWAEDTSLGFMASVLFPAQLCLINDNRMCFMIMMMQKLSRLLKLVIKLCLLRMEKIDPMTNNLIQYYLNLNDFELNTDS